MNNTVDRHVLVLGATGKTGSRVAMRTGFAGVVSAFLDRAERTDVQNVTYLSAYGMEHAPAEVTLRAVELDLMSRVEVSVEP